MASQHDLSFLHKGIHPILDAFIVFVKTEWNEPIVTALEQGAQTILETYHIQHTTIIVPGAIEIPFAIHNYAKKSKRNADAFIALGCIIKGDTPHFDYVCQSVTQGVLQLNLELPVPTIFGVLTVHTAMQAQQRIGGTHGHKGEDAALSAIKMITLNRTFSCL